MDKKYNNYVINNAAYEGGFKYPSTPPTENPPDNYKQETADNNAVYEIPVMGATEEIAILNAIDNDISVITRDTTVDMESTGVDINNTGVRVETTGVGIKTPGVQYTSHEDNNNEGEYDDTSKTADRYPRRGCT